MKKEATYLKIPQDQLDIPTFQEEWQKSINHEYYVLIKKVVIMLHCKPEDLEMIQEQGKATQLVKCRGEEIGKIFLDLGYDGTDLVNNQITARWIFTPITPRGNYKDIAQ